MILFLVIKLIITQELTFGDIYLQQYLISQIQVHLQNYFEMMNSFPVSSFH